MIELININGTGFTVEYLNGLVQSLLDTFVGLRSKVVTGLTLEVDSGLDLLINPGTYISTQLITVSADIPVTVADDSEQYVWIDVDEAITFTDTWAEVTDNRVCLGKVTTASGVMTIRYDRRMQELAGAWDAESTFPIVSGTYVLEPDVFKHPTIKLTGTLAAAVTLVLPEWPGMNWVFDNQSNNAYAVKVKDYLDNEVTLGTGITQLVFGTDGPVDPGV